MSLTAHSCIVFLCSALVFNFGCAGFSQVTLILIDSFKKRIWEKAFTNYKSDLSKSLKQRLEYLIDGLQSSHINHSDNPIPSIQMQV